MSFCLLFRQGKSKAGRRKSVRKLFIVPSLSIVSPAHPCARDIPYIPGHTLGVVLLHKFVRNKFEQLQLARRVRAGSPNNPRIHYILSYPRNCSCISRIQAIHGHRRSCASMRPRHTVHPVHKKTRLGSRAERSSNR